VSAASSNAGDSQRTEGGAIHRRHNRPPGLDTPTDSEQPDDASIHSTVTHHDVLAVRPDEAMAQAPSKATSIALAVSKPKSSASKRIHTRKQHDANQNSTLGQEQAQVPGTEQMFSSSDLRNPRSKLRPSLSQPSLTPSTNRRRGASRSRQESQKPIAKQHRREITNFDRDIANIAKAADHGYDSRHTSQHSQGSLSNRSTSRRSQPQRTSSLDSRMSNPARSRTRSARPQTGDRSRNASQERREENRSHGSEQAYGSTHSRHSSRQTSRHSQGSDSSRMPPPSANTTSRHARPTQPAQRAPTTRRQAAETWTPRMRHQ
jgi:hypothetical protein